MNKYTGTALVVLAFGIAGVHAVGTLLNAACRAVEEIDRKEIADRNYELRKKELEERQFNRVIRDF